MPRPQPVPDPPDTDEEVPARLVTVDYGDHTYSFDADTVTIDALEDFENQKYIRAVRAILGPEQWALYKSRHPKAVELDRFLAALLAGAGALGNSPASPAS